MNGEFMNGKKSNIIKDKSFTFALRIVKFYKFLIENKEFVLSKQLLRSGTSVGAMIRESEHAESKADFIHKMAIAQKEANEAAYWIELLFQSKYLTQEQYKSIIEDINELQRLWSSIILSSKGKYYGKK